MIIYRIKYLSTNLMIGTTVVLKTEKIERYNRSRRSHKKKLSRANYFSETMNELTTSTPKSNMEGRLCYLQQRIREGLTDVSYGTPVCVDIVVFCLDRDHTTFGGKKQNNERCLPIVAAPRITHCIRISTRI